MEMPLVGDVICCCARIIKKKRRLKPEIAGIKKIGLLLDLILLHLSKNNTGYELLLSRYAGVALQEWLQSQMVLGFFSDMLHSCLPRRQDTINNNKDARKTSATRRHGAPVIEDDHPMVRCNPVVVVGLISKFFGEVPFRFWSIPGNKTSTLFTAALLIEVESSYFQKKPEKSILQEYKKTTDAEKAINSSGEVRNQETSSKQVDALFKFSPLLGAPNGAIEEEKRSIFAELADKYKKTRKEREMEVRFGE
ncbi:hypothetical protein C5167_029789 [Papaver somniferum]|nr:hypothetical protein C5167_029789 [Papaver somniferum]